MIFLTDGRIFLGPYDPSEVQPRIRGERWLREVHRARAVFRIEAPDEMAARRSYRRRS